MTTTPTLEERLFEQEMPPGAITRVRRFLGRPFAALYQFHLNTFMPRLATLVLTPIYFGGVGFVRAGRSLYNNYCKRRKIIYEPDMLAQRTGGDTYWLPIDRLAIPDGDIQKTGKADPPDSFRPDQFERLY